ncbi:MAG TPA: monofunctional biosynthetic peptidoglycan transglycosylase [Candidatus Koribacter sp.]|jgi:monofunctional biosynthetic peptidoglycan transglycosylase
MATASTAAKVPRRNKKKSRVRAIVVWIAIAVALLWSCASLMLVMMRWVAPPTTAVQTERRMQSLFSSKPYQKRQKFVPLSQISPDFQHAVISAEDGRFYQHHGFDWQAIQQAAKEDMEGGRTRGGSTLTQQLVKNLFFGTGRSFVRKGAEATLVPVAELALGKKRILELYMNEVEWGPGVYGAEAASRYWDRTPARNIGREQGARLAAILPAPLKRHPERMNSYSGIILRRMAQVGW